MIAISDEIYEELLNQLSRRDKISKSKTKVKNREQVLKKLFEEYPTIEDAIGHFYDLGDMTEDLENWIEENKDFLETYLDK